MGVASQRKRLINFQAFLSIFSGEDTTGTKAPKAMNNLDIEKVRRVETDSRPQYSRFNSASGMALE